MSWLGAAGPSWFGTTVSMRLDILRDCGGNNDHTRNDHIPHGGIVTLEGKYHRGENQPQAEQAVDAFLPPFGEFKVHNGKNPDNGANQNGIERYARQLQVITK